MIAANELRPGNYIYKLRDIGQNQYKKVLFQVASIDDRDGHLENYDFDSTTTEYCEPIPLTYEILDKISGFEKQGDGRYYCRRLYLKMREHDLLISSESWDTITVLSYLHQLQNLYAVVRQIELQIKLPATV